MAKLIYSVIASLDGYVEDAQGRFDWAAPDRELMAAVNELERPIGIYLYGRRMYETMLYWETNGDDADHEPEDQDFTRIWRAAEKVVYTTTLRTPASAKTRIERDFDPRAVRLIKEAATADISIGGAEIAGRAIAAGLVDECHLFLFPILVGGGKRALPDGARVRLELLGERRFGRGVVHLHYRVDS